MCGRYEFRLDVGDLWLQELLKGAISEQMLQAREVRPGDLAPAIFAAGGKICAQLMRWGFDGPRGIVINARSETAEEKSMFCGCVRAYRCLLPAHSYFEWHRETGAKYRISEAGGAMAYMAGLYLPQLDGPARFVVLTRPASAEMEGLHPRMPLIFASAQERRAWLLRQERAVELLHSAHAPALVARAEGAEQLSMFSGEDGLM